MNTTDTKTVTEQKTTTRQMKHGQPKSGHGHRWMMIACCIPMLVIAIALVVTGVASVSFIVFAVLCTLMMALMMGGMDHGGSKQ